MRLEEGDNISRDKSIYEARTDLRKTESAKRGAADFPPPRFVQSELSHIATISLDSDSEGVKISEELSRRLLFARLV